MTISNNKQNRPDRDSHVTINWENIKSNRRDQFRKETWSNTLGEDYDFYSVMHYGQWDFSSNGKVTITPKESVSQTVESTKNKWNI